MCRRSRAWSGCQRESRDDRRTHSLEHRQPVPGAHCHGDRGRLGRVGGAAHSARCAARSVGHPGHHPHQLAWAGAPDRGEPGHLPADHHHAVGARGPGGARVLDVRRQLRLRAVRRWGRPVLGPIARAGVPQPGAGAIAGRRALLHRPGRHRRGLDLPVRADRSQRPAGCGAASRAARLVPAL